MNKSFLEMWGFGNENEVLGKSFVKLWENEQKASKILERLHHDEDWRDELVAVKKDGTKFDAQLSANPVKDKTGKIIGTMASFIDITERKRLEELKFAIFSISEEASSAKNPDDLYPKIHDIVNELIPADNFYIALYDEKTGIVCFPYYKDAKDPTPEPRRNKRGMTEYVIRSGEPVLVSAKDCEELGKKGEIERFGTPPVCCLGVPLKTTDRKTIGVLAVKSYEEEQIYTEEDRDMLLFVSTQIAMAIERKRDEQRKEVLMHEIHHRVKNNFNFIYNLLDMQSRQIGDRCVKEQFNASRDRIMSMALVHEKLYRTRNLSEIDFTRYARDLSDSLVRLHCIEEDKISLTLKIKNVSLDIDKATPCGLIINELVTNSLKYAFPLKHKRRMDLENEIVIELYPEDEDSMVLRVMDNGVGLPGDIDFFETPSLGLRLVRLLTKQIHGTIYLNQSCGTDVTIKFKV
jgi:PAS domain S-box-containing protein